MCNLSVISNATKIIINENILFFPSKKPSSLQACQRSLCSSNSRVHSHIRIKMLHSLSNLTSTDESSLRHKIRQFHLSFAAHKKQIQFFSQIRRNFKKKTLQAVKHRLTIGPNDSIQNPRTPTNRQRNSNNLQMYCIPPDPLTHNN